MLVRLCGDLIENEEGMTWGESPIVPEDPWDRYPGPEIWEHYLEPGI